MEVKLISIKPSSPMPHHLENQKLSLLDQSLHLMYIPMVLYYPMRQKIKLCPTNSIDHVVSKDCNY